MSGSNGLNELKLRHYVSRNGDLSLDDLYNLMSHSLSTLNTLNPMDPAYEYFCQQVTLWARHLEAKATVEGADRLRWCEKKEYLVAIGKETYSVELLKPIYDHRSQWMGTALTIKVKQAISNKQLDRHSYNEIQKIEVLEV